MFKLLLLHCTSYDYQYLTFMWDIFYLRFVYINNTNLLSV